MSALPRPPQVAPPALFRARLAWGDEMPPWIEALAKACDAESQKIIAQRLGYSTARVSQIINRKSVGDPRALEQAVRGAFMGATVACPALKADIAQDICVSWRRRPYDGANHQTVRMFQACRACPHGGGAS